MTVKINKYELKKNGMFGQIKPLPGQKGYKMKQSDMLLNETNQMKMELKNIKDQIIIEKNKSSKVSKYKSGTYWKRSSNNRGSIRNYANDVLLRKDEHKSNKTKNNKYNSKKSHSLSKSDSSLLKQNIKIDNWTIDDVQEWLRNIELSQYQQIFKKNEIDGKTLTDFTIEDLDYLNITILSHRKIILREIQNNLNKKSKLKLAEPTPIYDDKLHSLKYNSTNDNNYNESKTKNYLTHKVHWSQIKPVSENHVSNSVDNDVPINLADGVYNEEANHESFLKAVMEWRSSDSDKIKNENIVSDLKYGEWNNPFYNNENDSTKGGKLLDGTLNEEYEHQEFRKAVELWRNNNHTIQNSSTKTETNNCSINTKQIKRQSCWHCYRLFFEADGINHESIKNRWFCSSKCKTKEG